MQPRSERPPWLTNAKRQKHSMSMQVGSWCSGITSASHAEGPGFKSQWVHFLFPQRHAACLRCAGLAMCESNCLHSENNWLQALRTCVFPPKNKARLVWHRRDSSVGRASDRRSEGPRFDPGSRHHFCMQTDYCFARLQISLSCVDESKHL